jgi:hypothetical protein
MHCFRTKLFVLSDWAVVGNFIRRLQYLDEAGNSLATILNPKTDPIRRALKRYTDMLIQPVQESMLAPLVNHIQFGLDEPQQLANARKVSVMCLSMVCEIYWRACIRFGTWPWKLGRYVRMSDSSAQGRWRGPCATHCSIVSVRRIPESPF